MTLSEIFNEMVRLQESGYFPDTIAFAPREWRSLVHQLAREEGCLFTPEHTLLGLKTKIIYDLKSDFLVYQSRTKRDPEWPHEYLRRLAVNSLEVL